MGSFPQLRLAVISLVCMTVAAMAEAPRIAIISRADVSDLSALIVTELTNDPHIALVERDELAKAGDEPKQQTLARSDASALGKLIGDAYLKQAETK